jgi:arabinogalactan endo-1,4-beta-galactosidase
VTEDKYAMQILKDHGVNYLTSRELFKKATGKDMPQEDQSVIYGQLKQEDIEKAVAGIKELVKNGTLKVEGSDVKEGTIYGGDSGKK